MGILHILNGDGLKEAMVETGIQGDFLIWREALTFGPVHPEVGSKEFISMRKKFLQPQLNDVDQKYEDSFIKEFVKLETSDSYSEIVLWFGQDYFCQINLMAILSYFLTKPADQFDLSLICVDEFPDMGSIKCLGYLSPEQLLQLFPKRKKISAQDLQLANRLWQAYCSNNPLIFNELLTIPNSETLTFLRRTVLNHLRLFPFLHDGLNELERKILKLASSEKMKNKTLIGKSLKNDQYYGFGDVQIKDFIQRLNPLLSSKPIQNMEDEIIITEKGKQVLDKSLNFQQLNPKAFWHGGAYDSHYLWDEQSQKLILSEKLP